MKKSNRPERRFIAPSSGVKVEYRDIDGERQAFITGTAIVFNSESRDLGGFTEVISPDALNAFFERTGGTPDVAALWNHDTGEVLGRTPKTLQLEVTESGLDFRLEPPRSRPDIVEAVTREDVRGASFAFTVAKGGEQWEERDGSLPLRTITEIDTLFEVSLVLQPAYESTTVGVAKRSLSQWRRKATLAARRSAERLASWAAKVKGIRSYLEEKRGG